MTIRPQIWITHDGQRLVSYAIMREGLFVAYARCFCGAMKAVEMIQKGIYGET